MNACSQDMVRTVSLLFLLSASSLLAVSFFAVGNSHTVDGRSAIGQLAASMAVPFEQGWHIRCSRGLDHMWKNPEDVCVDPSAYGLFQQALVENDWDVLMLQPFDIYDVEALPENQRELNAAVNFIEYMPNPPGKVVLYTTWCNIPYKVEPFEAERYASNWLVPYAASGGLVDRTQGFMIWLYANLKRYCESAGIELVVIPGGEILLEAEQWIARGDLPGFTSIDDCFRDGTHMSLAGRYLMSVAIFSEVADVDPRSIPLTAYYRGVYGGVMPVNDEQAVILREIVHKVLAENRFEMENIPVDFSIQQDGESSTLKLRWHALSGYSFRLMRSLDLSSWEPVVADHVGDGQSETFDTMPSEAAFFRLEWE